MKRTTVVLFLVVAALGACGGGQASVAKPAPEEAKPVASEASALPEAPGAAETSAAAEVPSAAGAASASAPAVAFTFKAAPAATAPSAPPEEEDERRAPPPPSKTQKGLLTSQMNGTPFVFVQVMDASTTCETVAKPPEGTSGVEVKVQWQTGLYDIAAKMAGARFGQFKNGRWRRIDAATGGVQVRAAPTQPGGTGRLHLQAARPGESIDVEIDVDVCIPVDLTPPKRAKKK